MTSLKLEAKRLAVNTLLDKTPMADMKMLVNEIIYGEPEMTEEIFHQILIDKDNDKPSPFEMVTK